MMTLDGVMKDQMKDPGNCSEQPEALAAEGV